MSENGKVKNTMKEFDLQQLASLLLRKGWIILLVGVLCAVITFVGTYCFITPQYESSTLFYVNNGTISIGGVGLSSSDLTVAQELVDSYIVILESRTTLLQIKDYAGVNRSVKELRRMISAAAVNSTEIFEVVVTSPDPYEAEAIAAAVAEILPTRISDLIVDTSAKVVDTPIVADAPSSPSYAKNTVVGAVLGLLICAAVIILRELFDVVIRSEEDVQRSCTHPVLATVPDMTSPSKGGYYERDAGKKHPGVIGSDKPAVLVGSGISFSASEAYKLLRTKLQFSFVDEKDCHVIGVSSAMAGEGKSLSAVNLAYSLAQLEKRVLLVDCDMRRPSLNAKLQIKKIPGLSNYLTRQVEKEEVLQQYAAEEFSFDVISAGRNPPNPIELLSSVRMEKVLNEFRGSYDYIILDLPPVGEVSDALVAAKLVDGILLVVRQNYCNTVALSAAVDQFSFVESRILGVVLNCTRDHVSRYGQYYRYRDHKGYNSRYEGSYMTAAKFAKKAEENKN